MLNSGTLVSATRDKCIEKHALPKSETAIRLILDEPPASSGIHSFGETEPGSLSYPQSSAAARNHRSTMSTAYEDAVFSEFVLSPSPDLAFGIRLVGNGGEIRSNMSSTVHVDAIAHNNDEVSHLLANTACIVNSISTKACTYRRTLRLNASKAKIVLHVVDTPNR